MTVRLFAGGGPFRSQWVILQARGDFAGHFAGHFAVVKWECGAAKWHACAKGVFRSCKMISQRVLGAAKWGFEGFRSCKMGIWVAKWHTCA